jgi:hypothetical protein
MEREIVMEGCIAPYAALRRAVEYNIDDRYMGRDDRVSMSRLTNLSLPLGTQPFCE